MQTPGFFLFDNKQVSYEATNPLTKDKDLDLSAFYPTNWIAHLANIHNAGIKHSNISSAQLRGERLGRNPTVARNFSPSSRERNQKKVRTCRHQNS
jgi:hypothetical protein